MSAPIVTSSNSRSAASTRVQRLSAVVGGTVAGLVVWSLSRLGAGTDLFVLNGTTRQSIGPVAVAVTSFVAGLAGWAVVAGLTRFTTRPRRIWTIVSVIVLLISLIGPLSGVNLSSKLRLAALHLTVGTVLIVAFRRTAPAAKVGPAAKAGPAA